MTDSEETSFAEPIRNQGMILPTMTLAHREVIRFVRQRSRWIGALLTPIVFWVLIGCGFRNAVMPPSTSQHIDYLQYIFPGMALLIVLFTSVFAMISVIEDRRAGFLQAVLVAPVPRMAIVAGKVLGTTFLAVAQAFLFLLLSPTAGLHFGIRAIFQACLILGILSVGLSALGLLLAWSMESIQGFHAVMNLLLMPMWMLSGALFPPQGASPWMQWVIRVNPLSYGVGALHHAFGAAADLGWPSSRISVVATITFSAAAFLWASWKVTNH